MRCYFLKLIRFYILKHITREYKCVNYSKFKDDLNLVLSTYEDGNSFENILNAFQACHIQLKLETDLEFIY